MGRKDTQIHPVALGLRAHSGWAALVAIGGSAAAPAVIQRSRVELADRRISGSAQPYHAAQEMKLEPAAAFIERCANATKSMAQKSVRDAVSELTGQGYRIIGSCVLMGSGRPLPDLLAILASHPLLHTAEGHFFRDALKNACESCGLPVSCVPERELLSHGAARLGIASDELQRRASELGRSVGPPWRQDEKLCAIAGWMMLSD